MIKKIDKSYFNKGLSQAITMIFSMFRVILFYRVYSLELVGKLLVTTSIVNILSPFVTLSASTYFIRERVVGNDVEKHIRAYVSYSYIVMILLSIIMYFVMKSVIVVVTIISMLLYFIIINLMVNTNVNEKFEVYVYMSAVSHPVTVLLTLILPSPFFVYTYLFLSQILVAIYFDRDIISYLMNPIFSRDVLYEFINNVKHFSISNISVVILNNIDMLILGHMFTYDDVSKYRLGVYIPYAIDSVTSTFSSVLFVRKGEDKYGLYLLMTLVVSSLIFAIAIPGVILSLVFGKIVDSFVVDVSRIFGIVSIIRIVNSYVSIKLIYKRAEKIITMSNLIAVTCDIIFNILLGFLIGVIGIPIATLISEIVRMTFNTYKLKTIEKVKSV